MALRGIENMLTRNGLGRFKQLVVHPDTTTPVKPPFHIQAGAEPTGTPVEGDLYFDSTTHALTAYTGSAWEQVGATPSGNMTVGGTLDVTGATTIAGTLNHKKQVTDTGGAYATPIVLTEAQSGRTILCDDAAGLDFTLPAVAAAQVGTWYEFLVTVSITSNNLRVTAASGDLLRGAMPVFDFDTANTVTYFTPDESDDLVFTFNGGTKGGKKGSWVRFTAIHATGWFVHGIGFGDGSLATPFA